MAFWKSPNFKALRDIWYERLKDEGFQDAEKDTGGRMELKQRASAPYRHIKAPIDQATKEQYYIVVAQCVHETEFRNEVDRCILTLHASGWKVCKIIDHLEEMGITRNRNTIRYLIRRFEAKWGIRSYNRKQLNLKE